MIDFPTELDLTKFVLPESDNESTLYDLYAVANHYGDMGSGHYIAYARNFLQDKWYCFDDADVTQLPSEKLKSPAAYVLFYMKRQFSTLGAEQLRQVINSLRNTQ